MKKTVALITVITLIFTVASVPVFGASVVDKGQCGDNAYWTLTSDGTLTVSGTGEMWDYSIYSHPPYVNYLKYLEEEAHPAKYIVVKKGITRIGNHAFSAPFSASVSVLTVKIPNTCTSIGEYAFACCFSLKKITIPNSVSSIGKGAFDLCKSITTLKIPERVAVIGPATFADCKKLRSVYLGSNIESIGGENFTGCNNLKDVYYNNTKNNWNKVTISDKYNDQLKTVSIHYTKSDPNQLSSWAEGEVNSAISAGLVPDSLQQKYALPVSREDVSELFIRLLEDSYGKPINDILQEYGAAINPSIFKDTNNNAVLSANALGIINGTGDSYFDPYDTLTRAQATAIINRIVNLLGVDTTGYSHDFVDVSGHWVESELGWPVHAGVINGVGNHKFAPDKELTTEQAIIMVYRASQVL